VDRSSGGAQCDLRGDWSWASDKGPQ
jgi:hypothetical protein